MPTYNPDIFEVSDEQAARRIILTANKFQSTDERWTKETPYLARLLVDELPITEGQIVLDYGCGIGRLAKALIENSGCFVVGVDSSQKMRELAPSYVGSSAFSVISRRVLNAMVAGGFRADVAISVWVLQHCLKPEEDIQLIKSALKPGAALGVVNMKGRAVPTDLGWTRDGFDVLELLSQAFALCDQRSLSSEVLGERVSQATYWGRFVNH